MALLKFINNKHTILYDTNLRAEVDVEINKAFLNVIIVKKLIALM
jgi:hypothetical protein